MKKKLRLYVQAAAVLLMCMPAFAEAGNISGKIKVRGLRSPGNILVYLNKAPSTPPEQSAKAYVMDQQNLTFLPHVLPIPVGAAVSFPNRDKVDHNVFSLSRTREFNLGSYKPGESKQITFDKPGIVELRCDVHAEIIAYILVMKNPFFAVTDKDGKYVIENVPPGKVTLKTWHEKLKNGRRKVMVPEGGNVTEDLELTRGTPGVLYK